MYWDRERALRLLIKQMTPKEYGMYLDKEKRKKRGGYKKKRCRL